MLQNLHGINRQHGMPYRERRTGRDFRTRRLFGAFLRTTSFSSTLAKSNRAQGASSLGATFIAFHRFHHDFRQKPPRCPARRYCSKDQGISSMASRTRAASSSCRQLRSITSTLWGLRPSSTFFDYLLPLSRESRVDDLMSASSARGTLRGDRSSTAASFSIAAVRPNQWRRLRGAPARMSPRNIRAAAGSRDCRS